MVWFLVKEVNSACLGRVTRLSSAEGDASFLLKMMISLLKMQH